MSLQKLRGKPRPLGRDPDKDIVKTKKHQENKLKKNDRSNYGITVSQYIRMLKDLI